MAQVRKFLTGGKPQVITLQGSDYTYDNLEKTTWGNLDDHARFHKWDNNTTRKVKEFLNYTLNGLKDGTVSMNPDGSLNVSEEWASDGQFNTKGHGLLKKDITDDNKGAAMLGTAYINDLIKEKVYKTYKAPEKEKLGNLTTRIIKLIAKDHFGDNAEAFTEGWNRLNLSDRKQLLADAITNLDTSELADTESFNAGKDRFITMLNGDLNDNVYAAYNQLGGSGLEKLLLGGEDNNEVSIDTLRKQWTEEGRKAGLTGQGLKDYVWLKERQYNESNNVSTKLRMAYETKDFLENINNISNKFFNERKDNWNKAYSNLNTSLKSKKIARYTGTPSKYFNSIAELRQSILLNALKVRNNQINPEAWKYIIGLLQRDGKLPNDGQTHIIPGTEDYNTETVLTIDGNNNIQIASMYDHVDIFGDHLRNSFLSAFQNATGKTLSPTWGDDYVKAVLTIQLYTLSHKDGGILKYQDGARFALLFTSLLTPQEDFWTSYQMNDDTLIEPNDGKSHNQTKFNEGSISAEEYSDTVGFIGDLLATAGALTGNPSLLAAGLATSGVGHTVGATIDDDRSGFGTALLMLGANSTGLLPEVSPNASTTAKVSMRAVKALPHVLGLCMAMELPEAASAIRKGFSEGFGNLTYDDWLSIGMGMSAIMINTRNFRNIHDILKYTKPSELDFKIKTKDGWATVSEDLYKKVKEANTLEEAQNIINTHNESADTKIGELLGKKKYLLFGKQKAETGSSENWAMRNLVNRTLKTPEEAVMANGNISKGYINMYREMNRPALQKPTWLHTPKVLQQKGIPLSTFKTKFKIKLESGGQVPKYSKGNNIYYIGNDPYDDWQTSSIVLDDINNINTSKFNPTEYVNSRKEMLDRWFDMGAESYYNNPSNWANLYTGTGVKLFEIDFNNKFSRANNIIGTSNVFNRPKSGNSGDRYSTKNGVTSWTGGGDDFIGGLNMSRRLFASDNTSPEVLQLLAEAYKNKGFTGWEWYRGHYIPTTAEGANFDILNKNFDPASSLQQSDDSKSDKHTVEGNENPLAKSKLQLIGEYIWNGAKNLNMADLIALKRRNDILKANKKNYEENMKILPFLKTPTYLNTILEGDFATKQYYQNQTALLNNHKPITSNAAVEDASRLERSIKGKELEAKGYLADALARQTSKAKALEVANANHKEAVDVGNTNAQAINTIDTYKHQLTGDYYTKQEMSARQPYLQGIEENIRKSYALNDQLDANAVQKSAVFTALVLSQLAQYDYSLEVQAAYEEWKRDPANKDKDQSEFLTTDTARTLRENLAKKLQSIQRNATNDVYTIQRDINTYNPFIRRSPFDWNNYGIVGPNRTKYSKGGTLSYKEKKDIEALKILHQNIRKSSEETGKNLRADKSEYNKSRNLMSALSADLIKSALGIK